MMELDKKEIDQLGEAFQLYDLDGDGLMKPNELSDLFKKLDLNTSEQDINDIFERNKIQENINLIDFSAVLREVDILMKDTKDPEKLRKAFRVFDHDNTGYVLAAEIKYMLMNFGEKYSEEKANELLRLVYINDDSEIEIEEFTRLLAPKYNQV